MEPLVTILAASSGRVDAEWGGGSHLLFSSHPPFIYSLTPNVVY